MMLQLNPPVPLETPRGSGFAIIFCDRGIEFENEWTVICDNGEIWTFRNSEIRAQTNITFGRVKSG